MRSLPPPFTLAAARADVRDGRADGIVCPCCDQYAKEYRRRLNAGMIHDLAAMYRAGGTETYLHLPTLLGGRHGGESARLSYWGFTHESEGVRIDGGRRGWWRVTRRGELFLRGEILAPERAVIYNGVCLELTGPGVTVSEIVDGFDLRELMAVTDE
jgi:hypothetical protein